MASSETPPLRQGVRIAPQDSSVSVEEALLAAGRQVGHGSLLIASRMNKAVVVFVKSEQIVHQLVASCVFIRDLYVQVSPLSVRSTRITVSSVPPFITNELLENELRRFGKLARVSEGLPTSSCSCLHQRTWTCPPDSTLHQRSWICPPDSSTRGAGPVLLTPLYTRGAGPVLLTPLYTLVLQAWRFLKFSCATSGMPACEPVFERPAVRQSHRQ
ncbi:hypothetical protein NHX12_023825 [Muraenolepis orangiensis]|uniref:Uncharacterized protein n=1 Tax=Muraenolepis orangiensis TaxID=630683 RepID=A0A9Q0ERQ1_9TELE|nr:hypothetical protein NHX12_023825 [Muraenolepis orangiensis]